MIALRGGNDESFAAANSATNLVLVADPDRTFRSALQAANRTIDCNFRFLFCSDPKVAMRALFRSRFCGAIIETSLRIRGCTPLLEAVCRSGLIPAVIAICSAHSDSGEIRARRQNVMMYLVKPVVQPILRSTIRALCTCRFRAYPGVASSLRRRTSRIRV